MEWSVRNLLNPVITRALIYGVNPIDLEFVLREVEKVPLISSRALENAWCSSWQNKADRFVELAEKSVSKNNKVSAKEYYTLAAQCYYACYLINSEDIPKKKGIYEQLSTTYSKAIANYTNKVHSFNIPFIDNVFIPSYLHLPDENIFKKPYACTVIFGGLGSCKEELNTLATQLVARGIAVLTPDMPGTGSSLFDYDIKCRANEIELAFEKIFEFINNLEYIDNSKLCTLGLCMGGGYAYRAATKNKSIKCCVNLFPLFINEIPEKALPKWMKHGTWADYQIGKLNENEDYYKEMSVLKEGFIESCYLMIHGNHDNWMGIAEANAIFDKTLGEKEKIIIEEQPVFSGKDSITHTMPVGEQMHWLKHLTADWIQEHLN